MTLTDLRPEDLPAWMRPRRRTFDWSLLIVLGFCVLAAAPLLTRHGIPYSTDAEMYELRSLEVARLVRSGFLFSRWGPDLNYGLGSPLFNYLAPLPHYLTGYHQVITDTSAADSINLFLALSMIAAGSGMYMFARQRWGVSASLVAALVYLYSPPVIVSLPYLKGDLGALMAMGALPWALFGLDRAYLHRERRNLVLAVGLLSAFVLSDARVAFLGLFVILAGVISLRRLPGAYRHVIDALFVTCLLTAFFWLPAVAEREDIRWRAGQPDGWTGAVPVTELFGAIPHANLLTLNTLPYRGVGVGTWVLALVEVGAAVFRRKSFPLDAALFLILGLVLLALSTPAFYRLWPSANLFLPLLPYHAALIAVFCLSVAAAQAARWLESVTPRWQPVGLVALCLVGPIFALPLLNPPPGTALPNDPDYLMGLQYELRGYHTGTFRDGLLLPGTAPALPVPLPNLVRDYESETFDRISRRSFSADAQINPVEHSLLYNRYIFDLSQSTNLEFNILYFPGWTATIDGKAWEVQPNNAGLIPVAIPQYSGELVILFEGTLTRNLSWALVTAGVAALLLTMRRTRPTIDLDPTVPQLGRVETISLTIALILYAGFVLFFDYGLVSTPSTGVQTLPGAMPIAFPLKSGVYPVGYTLTSEHEPIHPGEQIDLTVFWQAPQAVAENDQAEIGLWNRATGQRLVAEAHRHPGDIPTSRWPPGSLIRDTYALTVPADAPPGDYSLQAAIRSCDSQSPLPCPVHEPMRIENDPDGVTLPETIHISLP